MRKKIRPIQGQQVAPTPSLAPNPIGPECIRVTKVYDWVVTRNSDRNKVPIPEPCFTEIENCRHAGNAVTASCAEIPGARTFDILSVVPANVPGVPGAVTATIAFNTQIRITFFCNGAALCDFPVPVSFVDDFILCNPPGTTIVPNIFDLTCNVLLNQMLGNMLMIDVVMCKEVQVEAEVKLEVQAKFCGPRPTLPPQPIEVQCPPILFPQQCPSFFPAGITRNCTCQGEVDFVGFTATGVTVTDPVFTGTVPGDLDVAALICDQCDLANSSIAVTFQEVASPTATPTPNTVDNSFTFTSTEFNEPHCTGTTLLVTGRGTLTIDGNVPEVATFSLTITDNTSAILTITAGTTVIMVNLSQATTPGVSVQQGPCSTFPPI
jgi:hypothetical protein